MDDIRWYVPTIAIIVAIALFLSWVLSDKKSREEMEQEKFEDARLYDADQDLKGNKK